MKIVSYMQFMTVKVLVIISLIPPPPPPQKKGTRKSVKKPIGTGHELFMKLRKLQQVGSWSIGLAMSVQP